MQLVTTTQCKHATLHQRLSKLPASYTLRLTRLKAVLDLNNNLCYPCLRKTVYSDATMKEQPENVSPLHSPTSPSKRRVHFADFDGLDLVSVKLITPANSEENLVVNRKADSSNPTGSTQLLKRFTCGFSQPASEDDFSARVTEQFVCLENVFFCGFAMSGTVKVKNIAFAKEVTARYTLDGWTSYRDVWADYVPKSSDGKTDRFQFRISIPHGFEVGNRIEFAIRYRANGEEYWDNNSDRNYSAECSVRTIVDK